MNDQMWDYKPWNHFTKPSKLTRYHNYSCLSVCPSVTEGQQKSVDPESKASASLDRTTQWLQDGCHWRCSWQCYLQVRALGCWVCGTGAKWRLTLTCVPRWLAKGPVLREAIGYGGFVEPGDCVSSFLHTEISGEKGKKANEALAD